MKAVAEVETVSSWVIVGSSRAGWVDGWVAVWLAMCPRARAVHHDPPAPLVTGGTEWWPQPGPVISSGSINQAFMGLLDPHLSADALLKVPYNSLEATLPEGHTHTH